MSGTKRSRKANENDSQVASNSNQNIGLDIATGLPRAAGHGAAQDVQERTSLNEVARETSQIHRQELVSAKAVAMKQDQLSLYNIIGRALAATERFIICMHPELQVERMNQYYDETTRPPSYDNPSILLGDVDLQFTLASKTVAKFVQQHKESAKEVLAALDNDLWEKWAPIYRGRDRVAEIYIANIWRILKNQPILIPEELEIAVPPPPHNSIVTHVMESAKAGHIISEQRNAIANNPDTKVEFQMGLNKQPACHFNQYNEDLLGDSMLM